MADGWGRGASPEKFNSIINLFLKYVLVHVEDKMGVGELCGQSTDVNVKKYGSVDKKLSGLLVLPRKDRPPRRRNVVLLKSFA